ncbi:hypothetical protein PT2222_90277 [Paraburkholderia tropica]
MEATRAALYARRARKVRGARAAREQGRRDGLRARQQESGRSAPDAILEAMHTAMRAR